MKHLVLFLIFTLALYFGWSYAAKREKRMVKRFTKQHVIAVGLVFVLAFGGLLLMFFNRAVNIL